MKNAVVSLALVTLGVALTLAAPAAAEHRRLVEGDWDGPEHRLGPVAMTSGSHRLEVGAATQLRVTVDKTEERPKARETIDLQRMRLWLRGSFDDRRVQYNLQLSPSPRALELLDVWGEYRVSSLARVRAGLFKIPFTRYRAQSFTDLLMSDWAEATRYFGAERQLGAMLHAGMHQSRWFTYALGVFSGENVRPAFEQGLAQSFRQPIPHVVSLRDPAPATGLHPELVGHVALRSEHVDSTTNSDPQGGPPRFHLGLSGAADLDPRRGLDYAGRLAPELLIKAYHFSVNVVGYGGLLDQADGGLALASLGLVAEAAYRPFRVFELAGRYGIASTLDTTRDEARVFALTADPGADPTTVAQERQWTETAGGVNFYAYGHSLKWQTDVALLRRVRVTATDSALRFQTQLQMAF